MLRRSPAFTLTVILTLALGIGANTAIFTVVNSVLLRPLPYRDPARLVAIWDSYQPQFSKLGVSPVEYAEWKQQTDIFEEVSRYRHVAGGKEMNLTGGPEPRRVQATCASSSLFRVLGVQPMLGRAFEPADDGPNGPSIALLGYPLWREYFDGNPSVIGSPIQLNGQAFIVAGVLPAGFRMPAFADLWLPEGQSGDEIANPLRHAFAAIARLKPGVSLQQASARLNSIGARLEREHPRTSKGFGFTVTGLQRDLAGNLRPALLVLLGAVTLVLLIACVNVANLLLSRAAGRRREMAIRIALGASRWRVAGESLKASIQLSLAGGIAGLALAYAGLAFLLRLLPPGSIDPEAIHMDVVTLAFLLATALATGLIFGLVPALQAARQDPQEGLKEGGRTLSRDTGAGRNALVISEFALALVLLIGAGLLIRSFSRLLQVVPGFQPANILTMRVSLSPAAYPDGQKLKAFYERLEDRLRALPGVVAIATANTLPLVAERANTQRFVVPGSPLMRPDTFPVAEQRLVTPDYFRTLGIPLRAGRQYTPADFNQPYIVVNETMARTFWPGEDPIGKKFISGPFGSSPVWSTVIGVVGDVKQLGLDSGHTNDFYYLWYGPTYLAVKTAGDPLALAPAIRREIRALDPSIPVSGLRTMEQVVDASTGERRFSTLLLSIFAAVALTLAVIGIYGIMSWSVEQRRREIGIRMAVGANARGIFGLVLARGLKLAFIGLTIGLAATLALTRLLTTLLFEISPTNPWILGGVSLLMLGVTVLACYVPARRAAEVDPMTTLRAE